MSICKGQSGKRVSLPYGRVAVKEFDALYIIAADAAAPAKEEAYVSAEFLEDLLERGEVGKILEFSCRVFESTEEYLEIPRKTYTKWFDYDKIKDGFCIRTRRSGDYLISDALGHRKKLKTYFIDEKIPVPKRDGIWILTMGSLVLWVIGGRISEHVKVSQKTKYILEITYDGGMKNE